MTGIEPAFSAWESGGPPRKPLLTCGAPWSRVTAIYPLLTGACCWHVAGACPADLRRSSPVRPDTKPLTWPVVPGQGTLSRLDASLPAVVMLGASGGRSVWSTPEPVTLGNAGTDAAIAGARDQSTVADRGWEARMGMGLSFGLGPLRVFVPLFRRRCRRARHWTHPGCSVRHRSPDAAGRCTRGRSAVTTPRAPATRDSALTSSPTWRLDMARIAAKQSADAAMRDGDLLVSSRNLERYHLLMRLTPGEYDELCHGDHETAVDHPGGQ
jgi:hypothetical protein